MFGLTSAARSVGPLITGYPIFGGVMAGILVGWALLCGFLAFIGTYWQKNWIIVALIWSSALLVWLLFRTVSLPPDNPAMPSRHLARIVYLRLGAIGASFGVLMGWLLGRALRSG